MDLINPALNNISAEGEFMLSVGDNEPIKAYLTIKFVFLLIQINDQESIIFLPEYGPAVNFGSKNSGNVLMFTPLDIESHLPFTIQSEEETKIDMFFNLAANSFISFHEFIKIIPDSLTYSEHLIAFFPPNQLERPIFLQIMNNKLIFDDNSEIIKEIEITSRTDLILPNIGEEMRLGLKINNNEIIWILPFSVTSFMKWFLIINITKQKLIEKNKKMLSQIITIENDNENNENVVLKEEKMESNNKQSKNKTKRKRKIKHKKFSNKNKTNKDQNKEENKQSIEIELEQSSQNEEKHETDIDKFNENEQQNINIDKKTKKENEQVENYQKQIENQDENNEIKNDNKTFENEEKEKIDENIKDLKTNEQDSKINKNQNDNSDKNTTENDYSEYDYEYEYEYTDEEEDNEKENHIIDNISIEFRINDEDDVIDLLDPLNKQNNDWTFSVRQEIEERKRKQKEEIEKKKMDELNSFHEKLENEKRKKLKIKQELSKKTEESIKKRLKKFKPRINPIFQQSPSLTYPTLMNETSNQDKNSRNEDKFNEVSNDSNEINESNEENHEKEENSLMFLSEPLKPLILDQNEVEKEVQQRLSNITFINFHRYFKNPQAAIKTSSKAVNIINKAWVLNYIKDEEHSFYSKFKNADKETLYLLLYGLVLCQYNNKSLLKTYKIDKDSIKPKITFNLMPDQKQANDELFKEAEIVVDTLRTNLPSFILKNKEILHDYRCSALVYDTELLENITKNIKNRELQKPSNKLLLNDPPFTFPHMPIVDLRNSMFDALHSARINKLNPIKVFMDFQRAWIAVFQNNMRTDLNSFFVSIADEVREKPEWQTFKSDNKFVQKWALFLLHSMRDDAVSLNLLEVLDHQSLISQHYYECAEIRKKSVVTELIFLTNIFAEFHIKISNEGVVEEPLPGEQYNSIFQTIE